MVFLYTLQASGPARVRSIDSQKHRNKKARRKSRQNKKRLK